jgi:hypothetical protein
MAQVEVSVPGVAVVTVFPGAMTTELWDLAETKGPDLAP